jgi:hypothetical protein
MKKTLMSFGLAAGLALASAAALPAAAGESDLARLASLNTGAAVSEIEAGVRAYADQHGITFDEALDRALAEATTSLASAKTSESLRGDVMSWLFGGAPSVVVAPLGVGQNTGDVFVAPASTFGVEHGHTGIYVNPGTIVEAWVGEKSRAVSAATRLVPLGTVKQSVNVDQAKRDAAARYAEVSLQGRPYNANFAVNRATDAPAMNCSQLVWTAFLAGAGIDIDSNGGLGVYPSDIRSSELVTTYATLR